MPNKIEVMEASQQLIDKMKPNLRQADAIECWATSHTPVPEALQKGFEDSLMCWVVLVDDFPVACFGVCARSSLRITGTPWMLATDKIEKIEYRFVKHSRDFVRKMLVPFLGLENYVDCRNDVSIKWLKWCGFKFDDPAPYGIERKMFRRFYLVKEAQ